MFCLKYIENDNHIMWLKNFMKRENVFFKSFSSFLLLKNKDISYLDDIYSKDILKSKTIDENCGFNKDIILYSDKCKIYNYDLAKKLVTVSSKFNVVYEQKFDYDSYELFISIYDKGDLIYSFPYLYNDEYDQAYLNKIIKGDVIMSKERERKIIDGVIKKLLEFDITIENYFYTISKECSDVFEVSLEHKDTGALILIKNINIDSENNIVKIGINKGLVF